MVDQLCLSFRQLAESLAISDETLRRLVEEEGLPYIDLSERVRIFPLFAVKEWLAGRIQPKGGAIWQGSTSMGLAPFANGVMGDGKPSSPTPEAPANANGSTGRRGGRQNRR